MKKQITIEDYRQLSPEGEKTYRKQWGLLMGDSPYIDIGDMIEYIIETRKNVNITMTINKTMYDFCDELWKVVKYRLDLGETYERKSV